MVLKSVKMGLVYGKL